MLRLLLQPAFILHRRPYRDTSLLLDAYTPGQGRLGLVARGARGPRSRLKGLLQPFTPLLLSAAGRGELLALTAAEAAGGPLPVPPLRFFSACYVNELVLRLVPRHDACPELFADYRRVLDGLAQPDGEEIALRVFEKRLLHGIGYGLQLETDALTGAPIATGMTYRYLLERGPVPAERAGTGILISGRSLAALQQEIFPDAEVLREVKRLTRAAVGAQLHGRPLHTRTLLLAARRLPAASSPPEAGP